MKYLAQTLVLPALFSTAYAYVIVDDNIAQVAFKQDEVSIQDWATDTLQQAPAGSDFEFDDQEYTNTWVANLEDAVGKGHRLPRPLDDEARSPRCHHRDEPLIVKMNSEDPFDQSAHPKLPYKCKDREAPAPVTTWWSTLVSKTEDHHRCTILDKIRGRPGCRWEKPHPPGRGKRPDHPHKKPPHRRRPGCGHGGHHHHHFDFSNFTSYELLEKSKYTTKIFGLIKEDEDLTKILNSTHHNYTFFAPSDRAFEHIPKGKKPSKEFIRDLLYYHTTVGHVSSRDLFSSNTVPTLLAGKNVACGHHQRIRVRWGRLNFRSRVTVSNIISKNGMLHALDSILIPPPQTADIIEVLPGQFSTLVNGLYKTGLMKGLADEKTCGTVFLPTNEAFKRLGPRALAFLFSKWGEKYLKALLQYHLVPHQVLYTDAFNKKEHDDDDDDKATNFPHGKFHADLPTLLKDHTLSVDIARFGRYTAMKVNGFVWVPIQDGVVRDGVAHIPHRVLIPPRTKQPPSDGDDASEYGISVEELKERLEPFVEADCSL